MTYVCFISLLENNFDVTLIISCIFKIFHQINLLLLNQVLDLPDDLITKSMFFDSLKALVRTVVVGVLAYIGLIFSLRISGKRTLSKMNAFDFIVTIALGSTLATILLSKDVALAEGMVALGLLVGLQYIIAWLAVRSSAFDKMIKSEPALVYYKGQFLKKNLKHERVTESEVLAAMREQGFLSLDSVQAVVLETTGSFSVVKKENIVQESTLKNIKGETATGEVLR